MARESLSEAKWRLIDRAIGRSRGGLVGQSTQFSIKLAYR